MTISCDLFCRVVDNLGDAGVCWRLARQLAVEHGWQLRLWIDDPEPIDALAPGYEVLPVEIHRWQDEFPDVEPAQVVIEAFACELPPRYIERMATLPRPPVWINLEYLSAEEWVVGCHGLPSPHPTLPLTKHFFFPGFVPGTGGLLRERDADFGRRGIGAALAVSLFCYENPALPTLLETWATGSEPIVCRVADGLPNRQVAAWLGLPFAPGETVRRGSLELAALPFVPQREYDRFLGACDLNFVRGEDSFVRAQWAERPFVWQAYPQADDAHWPKLKAFLGLYGRMLPEARRVAMTDFCYAWNGRGDIAVAWPAFRAALPALAAHAAPWAEEIASPGNLVENLVNFCRERI
ncbi:MAG TPA: elongation factor P maturation arginine rhamnosyltransferase EarP [Rhodocyclaceae bacterium]|nr:elongation factor P maturation arginine rhamnosyltransferase EarP [Rhodocyclaceae bacterium]